MEKKLKIKNIEKNKRDIELIKRAKKGDKEAINELYEANQGLVALTLKKYYGIKRGDEKFEDCFQHASMTFVKCIKNYKENLNTAFTTFVVSSMALELRKYFLEDNFIKMNRNKISLYKKVQKYSEEYKLQNDKEPTLKHLSEVFDKKEKFIKDCIEMYTNCSVVSSADVITKDKNGEKEVSLYNLIIDDRLDIAKEVENKMLLEKMFKVLTEVERDIIKGYFFEDKTQVELGEEFDFRQVYISRIIRDSLKKMKEAIA